MSDNTIPVSHLSTSSSSDAATLTFADFGLDAGILRALTDQGYTVPTPIQAQAIPVVLQGRDVMGAAQTGTGKTAGFSLPILQLLMQHANTSASPARHPIRALILTPTRELADQVAANVDAYARHTPLRSTVVFGGVDMAAQTATLRGGVEIVIATPGRLLDHVQQKSINLSQTQILVMDEADRMLDMGFLPDLQRIINLLPKVRQNLMFSATFSPEIKKLAATFLDCPVTIEVARNNAASENITQTIYRIQESAKAEAVVHLIATRQLKQVLVFSNTKIGASRLTRQLLASDIKATAIHGDKTQGERMAALEAFKQGEVEVLVATDVAARGLDIAELPCVINYDLPYNAEDYVHRIGRTGRAGASGDAISFYCDKDERLLVDIEKLIRHQFERETLTGFVAAERAPRREAGRPARDPGNAESVTARNAAEPRKAPASASASATPGSVSRNAPGQRRERIDPWFLKPYEPSASTLDKTVLDAVDSSASSSGTTKSTVKPRRAALLGGLPKS